MSGGASAAAVTGAALLLLAAGAGAEPLTLRLASVAPEGTAWARELRAFGREVTTSTGGEVQVKWYLSGIAGDELASHERVGRDQLDGVVSGGMLCQRLAPSMRAAAMAGEFRDEEEAHYVLSRLRPTIDAEMARAGYVSIGIAGMGFSIIFSRAPVRSMADFRRLHPWLWSLDEVLKTQLAAMGIPVVPLPLEGTARAFDEGRIDGFVTLPSAALAFQWSAQARYVSNLRIGYLTGCMLVARRAWDALSREQQQRVESAAAKLQVRIEDAARESDGLLLGGLFARQGMQSVAVSPALQAEFSEAARAAQARAEALAPPETVQKVSRWLAERRQSQQRSER